MVSPEALRSLIVAGAQDFYAAASETAQSALHDFHARDQLACEGGSGPKGRAARTELNREGLLPLLLLGCRSAPEGYAARRISSMSTLSLALSSLAFNGATRRSPLRNQMPVEPVSGPSAAHDRSSLQPSWINNDTFGVGLRLVVCCWWTRRALPPGVVILASYQQTQVEIVTSVFPFEPSFRVYRRLDRCP